MDIDYTPVLLPSPPPPPRRPRISPAQRAWLIEANSAHYDAAYLCNAGLRPDMAALYESEDASGGGRRGRGTRCSLCGGPGSGVFVDAADIVSTRLVAATRFCSERCAAEYYEQALRPLQPHLVQPVLQRVHNAFAARRQSLDESNAANGDTVIVSAVEAGLVVVVATAAAANDELMS